MMEMEDSAKFQMELDQDVTSILDMVQITGSVQPLILLVAPFITITIRMDHSRNSLMLPDATHITSTKSDGSVHVSIRSLITGIGM
jgi:hypothetical protein